MKVREIAEKIRLGEMKLHYAGHDIWLNTEEFLKKYERIRDFENGNNDNNWRVADGESVEKTNAAMRERYKTILDREIDQEEEFSFGLLDGDFECGGCGERLYWILTGNKLQLRGHEVKRDDQWGFVNYPVNYRCPNKSPRVMGGEIQIRSRFIFANFFRQFPESPKKYDPQYSLNHTAGRERVTAYKLSQNVAYGQMGNMSVSVFVHPNQESVLVGKVYDGEKERMELDGHYRVGKPICLDVWRYEATDLETLGAEYENVKKSEKNRGLVEAEVKYGTWVFEHYYDQRVGKSWKKIYSRFTLKK